MQPLNLVNGFGLLFTELHAEKYTKASPKVVIVFVIDENVEEV